MSYVTERWDFEAELLKGERKTITLTHPVLHGQFRKMKRNPIVMDMIVKMQAAGLKIQSLPDTSPEKLVAFTEQITYLNGMLEESAVTFIEDLYPGLIETLTFQSANDLISAVIEKSIKEVYHLGEAIKALETAMETNSESTQKDSTSTSSTPSVEN